MNTGKRSSNPAASYAASAQIAAWTMIACVSCSAVATGTQKGRAGDMASTVTITRDAWGVPYIEAPDEATASFGLAYAMAEDAFYEMEDAYSVALGTASAYYGERDLESDILRVTMRSSVAARAQYDAEAPPTRRIWSSFADGLNYYISTHPDEPPRQIAHYEGWMVEALANDVDANEVVRALPASTALAWTEGPTRAGGATLFISSSKGARPYEMNIRTADGWAFHGFARLGAAMPSEGFTANTAYAVQTEDLSSRVLPVLLGRSDTTTYKSLTNPAVRGRVAVRYESVRLNTSAGVVPRTIRILETDEGPVVRMHGDTAFVLRTSAAVQRSVLSQLHAFAHAADTTAFRAALDMRTVTLRALFVQAAGTSLLSPVEGGAVDVSRGSAGFATGRRDIADHVFQGDSTWTLNTFVRASFDTRVYPADTAVRALADEWEQVGARNPNRAQALDSALSILRSWDRISRVPSEAMTLYAAYRDELDRSDAGAYRRFTALERVVRDRRRYPPRPWGSINAIRRSADGALATVAERRSEQMPVAGAPARYGTMFAYDAGAGGESYVWAVDLRDGSAGSVRSFGQSSRPTSPHWFDQAALFAAGSLKPATLATPAGTAYRPRLQRR